MTFIFVYKFILHYVYAYVYSATQLSLVRFWFLLFLIGVVMLPNLSKPLVVSRKFVFFNIPQIQYKNPWVQVVMFKNMTPSSFLKFYLGEFAFIIDRNYRIEQVRPS